MIPKLDLTDSGLSKAINTVLGQQLAGYALNDH
jgi:hypothetical protein